MRGIGTSCPTLVSFERKDTVSSYKWEVRDILPHISLLWEGRYGIFLHMRGEGRPTPFMWVVKAHSTFILGRETSPPNREKFAAFILRSEAPPSQYMFQSSHTIISCSSYWMKRFLHLSKILRKLDANLRKKDPFPEVPSGLANVLSFLIWFLSYSGTT